MSTIKQQLKKTEVKKEKREKRIDPVGVLQVFVVVSIIYSTYIVAMGTVGYVPKIMLIPQGLFVAILLLGKFARV